MWRAARGVCGDGREDPQRMWKPNGSRETDEREVLASLSISEHLLASRMYTNAHQRTNPGTHDISEAKDFANKITPEAKE